MAGERDFSKIASFLFSVEQTQGLFQSLTNSHEGLSQVAQFVGWVCNEIDEILKEPEVFIKQIKESAILGDGDSIIKEVKKMRRRYGVVHRKLVNAAIAYVEPGDYEHEQAINSLNLTPIHG